MDARLNSPSLFCPWGSPEERQPSLMQVLLCLGLACLFWWIIFGLKLVNFWLGMALAASTLAALGAFMAGLPWSPREVTRDALFLGFVSAVALYVLFWLGYAIAQELFSFSRPQVGAIYAIRNEAHPTLIALVLLFITSPAEELFWRGFIQRWAMNRFGLRAGWLVGAAIYGGVHVFSGNIMLTLAALVAGLFWGALYASSRSLTACIISHALWTAGIFVFWPIAV